MEARHPRLRICVHALDRTGPPMLALTFLRWVAEHHEDWELDVVAFRGGALLEDYLRVAPVIVMANPFEAWDHQQPDPVRVEQLAARTSGLPPADTTLLVSIAAAQVLPYLHTTENYVVAWVVEQGDDLHWLHSAIEPLRRVNRVIAGSVGTQAALARADIPSGAVAVVGEFVAGPSTVVDRDRIREFFGATADSLVVVGVGIGTYRKGIDRFWEVAHRYATTSADATFVWIGGESDPLYPIIARRSSAAGTARFHLVESVPDIDSFINAADVFLHTARLDAFPLVCLHAALNDVPVVGFANSGGLEEMFGDTFVGVPYPDIDALLDQIRSWEDPARRGAIAAVQHDRVAERYEVSVCAPRLWAELAPAAPPGGSV